MAQNHTSAEVVIVGGGIAGCAVAYYLTTLGVRPIVVERVGIASAISPAARVMTMRVVRITGGR